MEDCKKLYDLILSSNDHVNKLNKMLQIILESKERIEAINLFRKLMKYYIMVTKSLIINQKQLEQGQFTDSSSAFQDFLLKKYVAFLEILKSNINQSKDSNLLQISFKTLVELSKFNMESSTLGDFTNEYIFKKIIMTTIISNISDKAIMKLLKPMIQEYYSNYYDFALGYVKFIRQRLEHTNTSSLITFQDLLKVVQSLDILDYSKTLVTNLNDNKLLKKRKNIENENELLRKLSIQQGFKQNLLLFHNYLFDSNSYNKQANYSIFQNIIQSISNYIYYRKYYYNQEKISQIILNNCCQSSCHLFLTLFILIFHYYQYLHFCKNYNFKYYIIQNLIKFNIYFQEYSKISNIFLQQYEVSFNVKQKTEFLKSVSKFLFNKCESALLFSDFLTHEFDQTQSIEIQIESLSNLFVLIARHGLEYPNYYQKLFSLINMSTFMTQNKQKFLKLLEVSLRSSKLPRSAVSAFLKKILRISLFLPLDCIMFNVGLTINVIKKHMNLIKMLENQDYKTLDVFQNTSLDMYQTNASNSKLYELKTLQNHYYFDIQKLLCQLEGSLENMDFVDTENFLDINYDNFIQISMILLKKKPFKILPNLEQTSSIFQEIIQ